MAEDVLSEHEQKVKLWKQERDFVAAEDRKTLKCVHAYTTDIDFEITPPMLVRKDLNV